MPVLIDRLRAALAGRYDVEQELGRGGMAVVYLGRDLRLERRVAIKVFEREAASGEGAERFLREIRVAAQLQHPNILPVHESGEAAGLVYYVMPYVAGASLRERLEREGPLPIADAVRIAREVAEALDHAHQAGIVHRDIKPDNIMLSGGVAVVADFGIARALEEAGSGKLTGTGMAVGTPVYMSPEQATAAPHIDGRADIYALGCVLYEMLAGSPPFSGPTAQAVMARHTADAVPPLSTVREVPPALEAAVVKALAKAPADRWATGRAFAEALEGAGGSRRRTWARVGIGVGAALVVAVGTWLAAARVRGEGGGAAGGSGAEAVRSLAVLPVTVSGDTSQTLLADGLMEALITGLWRVEGLRVPASSRVLALRDRSDPLAIGKALDVAAVISANVQVSGNRLRVTAQLTNVVDGAELWRRSFDGERLVNGQLKDVFSIQDEMTAQIVDALQVRLTPASRAALARGVRTRDPVAYDLYQRARRASYELTLEGIERAIALYQQAIARDSTFADAWSALADAYSFYAQFGGLTPAELAVRWRMAAERAIELDSLNGWAFAMRGALRSSYDWDWDGAWRDMRRAVALSPASAQAALLYAQFLNLVNEPESALVHMRRAVALDPTSSFLVANLAARFLLLGLTDSTIAYGERALVMDSTQWVARFILTQAFLAVGRRADAERHAARILEFTGDSLPFALSNLAEYYGRTGQLQRAREMLDRLVALSRQQFVQTTYLGVARLAVGDRAGALDALEASVRNRDLDLAWHLTTRYEVLNGDPRFEAVRQQVFGAHQAFRRRPLRSSRRRRAVRSSAAGRPSRSRSSR